MCQLLGMNANTPTDVMFSFAGLAHRAHEHKDGFGIGFFEGRGLRHFIDHHGARTSPVAELVKRYPIKSRTSSPTSARPRRAAWRWKTPTLSCASCGAATGCWPTTAT
jgi:hypothetical protein